MIVRCALYELMAQDGDLSDDDSDDQQHQDKERVFTSSAQQFVPPCTVLVEIRLVMSDKQECLGGPRGFWDALVESSLQSSRLCSEWIAQCCSRPVDGSRIELAPYKRCAHLSVITSPAFSIVLKTSETTSVGTLLLHIKSAASAGSAGPSDKTTSLLGNRVQQADGGVQSQT
jgi:hypothetical protein